MRIPIFENWKLRMYKGGSTAQCVYSKYENSGKLINSYIIHLFPIYKQKKKKSK